MSVLVKARNLYNVLMEEGSNRGIVNDLIEDSYNIVVMEEEVNTGLWDVIVGRVIKILRVLV